jgi:hypothetical protein
MNAALAIVMHALILHFSLVERGTAGAEQGGVLPQSLSAQDSVPQRPIGIALARRVSRETGFNYISYRWAVSDTGLQMFPEPKAATKMKWSYFVARTLQRLNPGRFF